MFCPWPRPPTTPAFVGLPVSSVFHPDGSPFAWSPARLPRRAAAGRSPSDGSDVVQPTPRCSPPSVPSARSRPRDSRRAHHARTHRRLHAERPAAPVRQHVLLAFLHGRQVSASGIRVASDALHGDPDGARMWAGDARAVASECTRRGALARTSPRSSSTAACARPSRCCRTASNRPCSRRSATCRSGPSGTTSPCGSLGWGGSHRRRAARRPGAGGARLPRRRARRRPRGRSRTIDRRPRGPRSGRDPARLHPHDQVLAAMRSAHLLVSSSFDFDNQPW